MGHVGTLSTRLDEGNPTVVVSKLHDGQKSQFLKNTFFYGQQLGTGLSQPPLRGVRRHVDPLAGKRGFAPPLRGVGKWGSSPPMFHPL